MPVMFSGFGTMYKGKSDVDANGVYQTTLFLVAFYVPIIPLGSYLVDSHDEAIEIADWNFDSSRFAVQVPLNRKQVLGIYLKWYGCIALAVAVLALLKTNAGNLP